MRQLSEEHQQKLLVAEDGMKDLLLKGTYNNILFKR